jgi:hypothetical protein
MGRLFILNGLICWNGTHFGKTRLSHDREKLSVPEGYVGKEVEVIAFAKEEGLESTASTSKQDEAPVFTILHVSSDIKYHFDRDEANER